MTLTQNYTDDIGFQIIINGSITINGNGHTLNFNQQNNNNIKIKNTYNVTLKNIILINGNNTLGGAIHNLGNLTLENTTFTNNTAKTDGGAIENYANLNIINSTFTNNTVTEYNGGAIHNAGSAALNITGSTFNNNTANGGGGAIYNNGIININNSILTFNTANGDGGAIVNVYNVMNIIGSTFTLNTANGNGGAIYNYQGTLTVHQSVLTNNTGNYTIYNYNGGSVIADGNYWGNNTPDFTSLVNFDVDDYYRFSLGNNTSTYIGNEISIDLIRLNTTEAATWTGPTINISSIRFNSTPDTATLNQTDNTVKFIPLAVGEYNLTATTPGGINSTITITVNPPNSILTVSADSALINGTLLDGEGNPIASVGVNVSIDGVSESVTTDENGTFRLQITVTKAGNHTVLVSFINPHYNSSNATGNFSIALVENITVNPITSVYGASVPFTARFNSNNVTIGEFIPVKIGTSIVDIGVVNSDNSVLFYIPGTYNVGTHTLSFYHNSNLLNTSTWTINKIPTSLAMSKISTVYEGYTLNIVVTLKAGGQVLVGKNVSFSGYGNKLTNSKGQAILSIRDARATTYTIKAQYTGDAIYKPSNIVSTKTTVKKLAITKTTPRKNQKGYKTRTITITFNQKIYANKYYSKIYVKNLKTKKKISITKKIKGNKIYITMKTQRTTHTYYQIYIPKNAITNTKKKTILKNQYIKFRT